MPMKMFQTTPWLSGTSISGLLRSKMRWPQAHPRTVGSIPFAIEDLVYRANLRQMVDIAEDFEAETGFFEVTIPLHEATANTSTIAVGGSATAIISINRGGYLVSASFSSSVALTADDTNYLTFTLSNKCAAGAQTIVMLAATAANTTKATGGASVAGNVPFALTPSATAAALSVAAGDVLVFTAASTGTLANAVQKPVIYLRFATLPQNRYTPRIARIATTPLVGPVANTAYGEAIAQFTSTNEAQVAGWDLGDQRPIPGNVPFIVMARVKVGTVTTAQRFVLGLGTAYNATFSTISKYLWFKLNASLAVTLESKDGTTTNTAIAPTNQPTLTAATYYWFVIDATDRTNVQFWIDLGSGPVRMRTSSRIDVSALAATDLLQPVFYLQKDSGTGTISATCDYMRYLYARV